jgi:aldehyde dehydrogenase (NAD+)
VSNLIPSKLNIEIYTGSGRVGRIVAQAAAKHLTPVTLEVGSMTLYFINLISEHRLARRQESR